MRSNPSSTGHGKKQAAKHITQSPVTPESIASRPQAGLVYQGVAVEYSGPIPDPETLARYDKAVSGSAERIIAMAEAQGVHRRQMEDKVIDAQIEDARAQRREIRRGQYFGLLIGCFAILCGSLVAAFKSPWSGGLIGCGGVAGLVSVFVLGRKGSSVGTEEKGRGDSSDWPDDRAA